MNPAVQKRFACRVGPQGAVYKTAGGNAEQSAGTVNACKYPNSARDSVQDEICDQVM